MFRDLLEIQNNTQKYKLERLSYLQTTHDKIKAKYSSFKDYLDGEFNYDRDMCVMTNKAVKRSTSAYLDNTSKRYRIHILNHNILLCNIVWFIEYGEFPTHCIIFIDGDTKNTHIDNLELSNRKLRNSSLVLMQKLLNLDYKVN